MVKRGRKTRKLRMRGGGIESCRIIGRGEETSTGAPKTIIILEDEMRVAGPEQVICYGDTFTTCQTLTIVFEDNWKVGIHLNATMFVLYDNAATYNPITLLPMVKHLMSVHPKLIGKSIKYIYLVSSLDSSVLHKRNERTFFETLNNTSSMLRLNERARKAILADEGDSGRILRDYFTQIFGARITDETEIFDINDKQIQHTVPLLQTARMRRNFPQARKNQHFYIFEDGSLELVYESGVIEYPVPE